jgi:hypothetical protein
MGGVLHVARRSIRLHKGRLVPDETSLKPTTPSEVRREAPRYVPYDAIGGFIADHVSAKEALPLILAERMKARVEHRAPLSDQALEVLRQEAKRKVNDVVFSGQKADRHLSNMAFLMMLRRMGRDDLTVHGFRSTFRDWAAERTT